MKRYVTEFIGTFLFVVVIGLAATKGPALAVFAPVAIGIALACMVYMGGHISGAHYNPAVTLAIWLRGKMPVADVLPYWVAQMAAAVLAAYVVNASISAVASEAANQTVIASFSAKPGAGVSVLHALTMEAIFTFALVLVVLQVATHPGVAKNSFYGFAIGGVVLAGAYAAGPISGGAFNPAVGVGPAIVAGADAFMASWIYVVGPFIGSLLAVGAFKLQGGMEA